MNGQDIVICEPVRTPVGRFGGALRPLAAAELGAVVVREVLRRTGVAPEEIDDVVMGHCYPTMEAPALGRVVALDAGLPVTVPGMQVDRRCGSGIQAVSQAANAVRAGEARVVIAGGAESMSNAIYYTTGQRWGTRSGDAILHDALGRGRVTAGGLNHPVPGGMLETAENLRREFAIPRQEQDELALESHRRALQAQDDGRFDEEIVPVTVTEGRKERLVTCDEHPRRDASLDRLAALRPVLAAVDPDATVTAGNASGQNDGASACLVTSAATADRLSIAPIARIVSCAVAGVPPHMMGIGPVPASAGALERAGLQLADMDLIDLNEAFAAQVLAVTRSWGFGAGDFERLNVNGSGISLGHPVGATGGRILATVTRELCRREGRYALVTLCIGGGQGIAMVLESLR